MSGVNWQNPYAERDGAWLRGNLHTHTKPASRCGRVPREEMLAIYAKAGYDFLALSDHMTITEASHPSLTLLRGAEWNAPTGSQHVGVYAPDAQTLATVPAHTEHAALLADVGAREALVILNHPNWWLQPHYPREALLAAQPYHGIEIYNGVIRRLDGSELATEQWDYLLSKDKRVLGVASDDAHDPEDTAAGWVMVRAAARTPEAIFAAMMAGNFYASTGVTFTDIRRDGSLVTVESADGQELHAIGSGGRHLLRVRDRTLAINLDDYDTAYLRVTAYGAGAGMAWTQPFFR